MTKTSDKDTQTTDTSQAALAFRILKVREKLTKSFNYTNLYEEQFGEVNKTQLRQVWNLRGLTTHIDMVENLEKLAKKYGK